MTEYNNDWRMDKDNGFMGIFVFHHVEDEASEHLIIFEMAELLKDITIPPLQYQRKSRILKAGTKFDAIWWDLARTSFEFIDWKEVRPGHSMPKDPTLTCTQRHLMKQGWWQGREDCCGPKSKCRCRK